MADSEICGTKDPTFHRILLDTRFELPLGECRGTGPSPDPGEWPGLGGFILIFILRMKFPVPGGESFPVAVVSGACTCHVQRTPQPPLGHQWAANAS